MHTAHHISSLPSLLSFPMFLLYFQYYPGPRESKCPESIEPVHAASRKGAGADSADLPSLISHPFLILRVVHV